MFNSENFIRNNDAECYYYVLNFNTYANLSSSFDYLTAATVTVIFTFAVLYLSRALIYMYMLGLKTRFMWLFDIFIDTGMQLIVVFNLYVSVA